MSDINFHRKFAADIKSGLKTQTIRRTAACKTGDSLRLFAGAGISASDLIGTATCAICEPITIAEEYVSVGYWRLPSGDAEHIAKIDGFPNLDAMRDFFSAKYGLPFDGYRIMWNGFKGAGE